MDGLLDFLEKENIPKNVFNFYSPDYLPNDDYFKNNNLVAPELQIQTAEIIINFSNRLQTDSEWFSRLYYNIPNIHSGKTYDKYSIHYVKERILIEKMLEGNYNNIRIEPFKTNAINGVFDYVNEKLTASSLSDKKVEIIKTKLYSYTYSKDIEGIRKMIDRTVNAIATTNRYMIQN